MNEVFVSGNFRVFYRNVREKTQKIKKHNGFVEWHLRKWWEGIVFVCNIGI